MRAREVNQRIEKLGGKETRQRGSHRRYEASTTRNGETVTARTTVAQHTGDIPNGTLRAIEKDMEPVFGEGWLR
ncbi:type II toxin-antitoxin system HicA family toxin [Micromonospora sp. NPDC050695]|uniref:type II toxin-antitoxin system HicA family toxin n=1 Tax=Micromonospora sp. NPDC050695 TaxID=3154938 RepID=UPI0033F970DD